MPRAKSGIKRIHNESLMHYEWYVPESDSRPATEEDWERRCTKRRCAVEAIKRTPEYTQCQNLPRAKTPDASARTSKRSWERTVQKWRSALRENVGSMESTDIVATV